jgi:hypothetical protein
MSKIKLFSFVNKTYLFVNSRHILFDQEIGSSRAGSKLFIFVYSDQLVGLGRKAVCVKEKLVSFSRKFSRLFILEPFLNFS